jgi:signal transduction histidine kinase
MGQQELATIKGKSPKPKDEILGDVSKVFREGVKPTAEAYKKAIRELTHANLRLRQLDKAKDEFISIASHELRNPMAIIKGNISMVLAGDIGTLDPEVKEILTDVMIAVERQIRLVNELLDISRIEAGVINFNLHPSIHMDQVAQLLVNSLASVAGNQGIEIKTIFPRKPLPPVQADHDKISQVMINLVTNAMKFTKKGMVTIETKQVGDYIYTCVTDTGSGIPPKQQELLFKKFSKPSSPSPGEISAGSGLGLYISKKYIEKQGGDIWLEKSEPSVGSTFCFSLPIAASKKATAVAEEIKSLQPIKEIHIKS